MTTSCSGMKTGAPRSTASSEFTVTELPPVVKVRVTEQGPVFTNAAGMTLYSSRTGTAGRSECKTSWEIEDPNLHPLLMVYSKYPAPPCTEQWPPLFAAADAKPVGRWSIIARPEGTHQWAYDGYPVHTSYLDFLPGDVNAAGSLRAAVGSGEGRVWSVVSPPMNLPPGVTLVMRNGIGLIAMFQGRVLYTLPATESRATLAKWRPLLAGEMARSIGGWSVVTNPDGSRQWARGNHPVYMYSGDTGPTDLKGFGVDQATPVTLYPVPPPPAMSGIGVKRVTIAPVYTNADGMTLYVFECHVRAPGTANIGGEAYTCRGWSDDPSQREQFCPAPDKCGEMWQPLRAPADAQPHGGVWSVAVIPDPVRYPLRWVPAGAKSAESAAGAIKVWTFKGRPLYTSVQDREPGDFEGHEVHQNSGQRWSAALAGDLEN